MKNNFNDDTFLARWLSNKLSDEELKLFEQSEDFETYKKIAHTSRLLKKPDFNEHDAFQSFLQNRTKKKKKTFQSSWVYLFAASVAILIGIFIFTPSETKYESKLGEQLTFNLPDGSKVELNAKSKISFNGKTWDENRNLNLKGEAYFKVIEGSKFTVQTEKGIVSVLGTEFNVNSRENYFDVQCFEGRVRVETKIDTLILMAGDAIRLTGDTKENYTISHQLPLWNYNESNFENLALKQVILELERQYLIRFNSDNIDSNKRFTGSFCHDNLKIALKTVFDPMGINYKIDSQNQLILSKKQ